MKSISPWVAGSLIVLAARSWAEPAPDPAAVPRATAHAEVAGNIRVAAMIPAGISTRDACVGFRSIGACSAALHASQNLSISFAEVRDRMLGGESLGAAIHAMKPRVDPLREVRRAEKQARDDLRPPG